MDIHLNGAAALIYQLFKDRSVARSEVSQSISEALCVSLESFTFHAATSCLFQHKVADSPAIQRGMLMASRCLDQLFASIQYSPSIYSRSPVLGLPSRLFLQVHEVSRIYLNPTIYGADLIARCRRIHRNLQEWDQLIAADIDYTGNVTDDGFGESCDQRQVSRTVEPNSHNSYLLLGPQLFALGCRILLARVTSDLDGACSSDANETVQTLTFQAMSLIERLEPGHDYYAEYYCWPFLVVGMSTVRPCDQTRLMAIITTYWEATLCGTMKRLADVLEKFWQIDISCCSARFLVTDLL